MRILVIDDEVEVAELLAEAVRIGGHDTTTAHDGAEGLASIARERPDAVFLDVAMPGISGIEVLRRIRASDARVPVFLITGRANSNEIEEAQRLGVAQIIEKPHLLTNLPPGWTRGCPRGEVTEAGYSQCGDPFCEDADLSDPSFN